MAGKRTGQYRWCVTVLPPPSLEGDKARHHSHAMVWAILNIHSHICTRTSGAQIDTCSYTYDTHKYTHTSTHTHALTGMPAHDACAYIHTHICSHIHTHINTPLMHKHTHISTRVPTHVHIIYVHVHTQPLRTSCTQARCFALKMGFGKLSWHNHLTRVPLASSEQLPIMPSRSRGAFCLSPRKHIAGVVSGVGCREHFPL